MFLDWVFLKKNFRWSKFLFRLIFQYNKSNTTICTSFQVSFGEKFFINGRLMKYKIFLALKHGFLEIVSSLMIELVANKKIRFFKFKADKKKRKKERKSFFNVFFGAKKNMRMRKMILLFQQISSFFLSKIVQIGFHFMTKKHNLQYHCPNLIAPNNWTTLPYTIHLKWNLYVKKWEEKRNKKIMNLPNYSCWTPFSNYTSTKAEEMVKKKKKKKRRRKKKKRKFL